MHSTPLGTWKNHTFFAAHLLILGYAISMVVTALLQAFQQTAFLSLLVCNGGDVIRGQVWRCFTYGLVNQPSISFVLSMMALYWFGLALERYLGRTRFLCTYAAFYILPALMYAAVGNIYPRVLQGEAASFGLFAVYALLFPNQEVFFSLTTKWVALGLASLQFLSALSNHDWVVLLSLTTTIGLACILALTLEPTHTPSPAQHTTESKELVPARIRPREVEMTDTESKPKSLSARQEMDQLLDKINRKGMRGLTASEKSRLQQLSRYTAN